MNVIKISAIALGLGVVMMMPAEASQTTVNTTIGSVRDVEVLRQTHLRKIPVEERICSTHDVPIYEEAQGGDELGGLVVGGLLGAAVGNGLTSAEGAGTAGAVAGALLGREHALKTKKNGRIIGYRQQDVCETVKSTREERVEEIVGYRLNVDVDGELITFKTKRSYDVGDTIQVKRRTTYSVQ